MRGGNAKKERERERERHPDRQQTVSEKGRIE